jgi:hypothetical protein
MVGNTDVFYSATVLKTNSKLRGVLQRLNVRTWVVNSNANDYHMHSVYVIKIITF